MNDKKPDSARTLTRQEFREQFRSPSGEQSTAAAPSMATVRKTEIDRLLRVQHKARLLLDAYFNAKGKYVPPLDHNAQYRDVLAMRKELEER